MTKPQICWEIQTNRKVPVDDPAEKIMSAVYCLGKYMAHLKGDKQVLMSACDGGSQSLQL